MRSITDPVGAFISVRSGADSKIDEGSSKPVSKGTPALTLLVSAYCVFEIKHTFEIFTTTYPTRLRRFNLFDVRGSCWFLR